MKKIFVLLLVLAIASFANAGLQISVDGEKHPVDSQIFTSPTGAPLSLGIWTDSEIAPSVGEAPGWQMVVQTNVGSISGGTNNFASEPGVVIYDDIVSAGFPAEAGANGVWGTILITGIIASIPTNATIFGSINFQCLGEGDAIVNLYTTPGDYVTWDLVDSVTIHQGIPEPATLSILGLGGLLLRRRKNKA